MPFFLLVSYRQRSVILAIPHRLRPIPLSVSLLANMASPNDVTMEDLSGIWVMVSYGSLLS
jgi:hypothetical protein